LRAVAVLDGGGGRHCSVRVDHLLLVIIAGWSDVDHACYEDVAELTCHSSRTSSSTAPMRRTTAAAEKRQRGVSAIPYWAQAAQASEITFWSYRGLGPWQFGRGGRRPPTLGYPRYSYRRQMACTLAVTAVGSD
jgi:hypothetical protein